MKILEEIKNIIEGSANLRFEKIQMQNDNLICLSDVENLIENISQLKKHPELKFKQLVDILAVDYPNKEKRFEVIYLLLSHEKNLRISVKVRVKDDEKIFTLTNIFPSANWLEREVFDMNGIIFQNHPDLRRILTDYEFEGFPLRKDFPLTGYKEVRYDPEKKKVTYEPVKLQQAYRDFDFKSPWQRPEYIKKEQQKNES
ncbi:MAG: NADH-quinone oxidoreductase subunit C [Pelagibacteraceae bacterium]